jgi:hypothetical protein
MYLNEGLGNQGYYKCSHVVRMSVQPDHMHFPRAPEVSAVVVLGLLTAGR